MPVNIYSAILNSKQTQVNISYYQEQSHEPIHSLTTPCHAIVSAFSVNIYFRLRISSQKKIEPPVYSPLQVLVPEATGKKLLASSPMILDVSNISQGYFIAQSDSSDLTCSLQIISPSGVLYSYFIAPGESATVTFTEGSGDYTITGYQQVQGDQYAALYSETVTVQLENDFLPFLYPNQYVNFTPDSKASQLALSLDR